MLACNLFVSLELETTTCGRAIDCVEKLLLGLAQTVVVLCLFLAVLFVCDCACIEMRLYRWAGPENTKRASVALHITNICALAGEHKHSQTRTSTGTLYANKSRKCAPARTSTPIHALTLTPIPARTHVQGESSKFMLGGPWNTHAHID
eukprot:6194043-Pleurochrysis_carterae.AAC.2